MLWRLRNLVLGLGLVVGTVLVTRFIFSSTETPRQEFEVGAVSGSAVLVNDSSASSGRAISFAAAPMADACDTFPAVPRVKPTKDNTGLLSKTSLTSSGGMVISTDNTIIENKDIVGSVIINASNVTIRNSKIHAMGDAAYKAIMINSGKGNKVINNEIYTTNGGSVGVRAENATICGNYIHGFETGLMIGGNMMVQANYLDRFKSGATTPRYNGIQVYSGQGSLLYGNNIMLNDENDAWHTDTASINVTASLGVVNNMEIKGNWLGGGSYSLYVHRQGSYSYNDIRVLENRWYGVAPKGFAAYGPVSDDGGGLTLTGNVWDSSNQSL